MKLEDSGLIDLLFGDETGFNLEPYIPYGWLPKGKQTSIPSERKRVGNVLGMMSRYGFGTMFWTKGSINSDYFIKSIDTLIDQIKRTTVLVLDCASWHTSKVVKQQLERWEEKGLFIFYLPPYSPHLNLIEMLWRKIKYEWLKPNDYESELKLQNAVLNILDNLNNGFNINFSKNFLFNS